MHRVSLCCMRLPMSFSEASDLKGIRIYLYLRLDEIQEAEDKNVEENNAED